MHYKGLYDQITDKFAPFVCADSHHRRRRHRRRCFVVKYFLLHLFCGYFSFAEGIADDERDEHTINIEDCILMRQFVVRAAVADSTCKPFVDFLFFFVYSLLFCAPPFRVAAPSRRLFFLFLCHLHLHRCASIFDAARTYVIVKQSRARCRRRHGLEDFTFANYIY